MNPSTLKTSRFCTRLEHRWEICWRARPNLCHRRDLFILRINLGGQNELEEAVKEGLLSSFKMEINLPEMDWNTYKVYWVLKVMSEKTLLEGMISSAQFFKLAIATYNWDIAGDINLVV
ncbi:hypothetical protein CDAR_242761 [Caerostris darwini]|uniref:Uncharacterized protein n=1 Tax=Caerostris darwini TaxID=1538125 RepID=A0AAV4W3X2_9ARAC|nr:hypothetical protein CDAR_242761 [Caerostris darwini]